MTLPFAGITVIELSRIYAAPWATQMLADFGADVVKLESPHGGDQMRAFGPGFIRDAEGKPTGDGGKFLSVNRNKRSVTVDIASPEGQEVVRDLVRGADVFVENFKVGDLARRKLDYTSLREVNPQLIYASVTGFGQSGPRRSTGVLDAMIQAYSGFMSMNGEEGGPPLKSGVNVMDFTTGMFTAFAIATALYQRENGDGAGQHIDVSLFDSGLSMMSFLMVPALLAGKQFPRTGSANLDWVPSGVFQTQDKPLYMAIGTDADFRKFAEVVERRDWLEDASLTDREMRNRHRERLEGMAQEVLSRDICINWVRRLNDAGLIAAPIYEFADILQDPQTVARGSVFEVEHPSGSRLPMVRNPIRFSGAAERQHFAPPLLGQHTDEVLVSRLSYSKEKIAALRARGAI